MLRDVTTVGYAWSVIHWQLDAQDVARRNWMPRFCADSSAASQQLRLLDYLEPIRGVSVSRAAQNGVA